MGSTWTPALTRPPAGGAQAYAESQRAEAARAERIRYLEAVRAVTEESTRELDLTILLGLITRRAVELVEAAVSGAVFLWDEAEQVMRPRAWHGYGEWMRQVCLGPGEGIAGAIVEQRMGLLVNDYQTSPYAHHVFVEHTGATSILGEPLLYHNRLVGVIVLNNGTTGQGFTAQDRELLTIFGAQAAIAIANAHLFAEVRQQTAELERANAALHHEIRERQQAEESLRQTRDELETRVEERTTELRLANAQLQRRNQELQDFAYVASHDLQEPLRKIQAFGDRLQAKCSEAMSEPGRDYLERMQNAARRMQTLINDLLMFSRVTTKAEPFVSVDLARVAHEVVSDLEVRLEQTGGRVEMGDLPTIDADPTQMQQLFQNLIGNALKFRREEEAPIVRVSGQSQPGQVVAPTGHVPDPDLCHITVADNGIGFDEKYLDRIFHVFQRLHGRSTYEGSGVGLAVCRQIVERHGGSITARSTPGHGATFLVTLPVTHAQHTRCTDMGSAS